MSANGIDSLLGFNKTELINNIETSLVGMTGMDHAIIDIILAITIIILSYGLAKLAKLFVSVIGPKVVSHTNTTLDDEIIKAVNGPLQLFIFVLGAYVAIQTLNGITPSLYNTLDSLLFLALLFIGAYLVANLVNAIINWYKTDVAPHTDSDLDDALMPFLNKVTGAVIFIIAGLMALGQFGVEITPLIASLGVAGVAVAIAAQELLSNLFGALAILTDRPYKVGDRIQITDTEEGDVIEIGLRSTRVKTLEDKIIIVPNSMISKSRIINYSQPDTVIRFKLNVGISYDADVEKATRILIDVASKTPGVLKEKPPKAYVSGLGDFRVNIILHVWVNDYRLLYEVPDKIYRETLKRFETEGIEIPYPITTVQLGKQSEKNTELTVEVIEKNRSVR
ncbi:mechanosensitive ion channel family protein [Methanocella sp. CWC-04]|uniref:Mechanosensitive ion channel family protein n=1 Tax=Methanooceanicella nereidis TaxID=2052831 RepID=A0AAP2REN7_9EURY|nr:mechanosensitive ion channel family protein [Methanocella sp. CWC-04]MCD1295792.1 mechanosensitive ion channel family protein [Methanocella sp. CWC-04]